MTSTPPPPPAPPRLAAAAVMLREDSQLLVVRYADEGPFAGRWGLPLVAVPDELTAEDALASLLRDGLHVEPGPAEFADTIYLSGTDGSRFIVNAFTCVDWRGEPRFEPGTFVDAGWIQPAAPSGVELVPDIASWLAGQFGASGGGDLEASALDSMLAEARGELLAVLDGIAAPLRDQPLGEPPADGSPPWTPLDVLAHVAEVEGYYTAEARRLLHEPGRTWRPFNADQWGDIRRLRPDDDEREVRNRAEFVRSETRAWLSSLSPVQLAAYGNHAERGVVQVGDRIAKVARHDREHLETLRRMAEAAKLQTGGA